VTDKQSRHPVAASAASTKFASETLAGLDRLGIEPVVIGGWAVRLYGSPVFSIDLDILMRPWEQGEYEIYDFIHERTDHHKSAYEDSYLETKGFDEPNRLWVTGESFIPGELLNRYGTEHRSVDADGYTIAALVPKPKALAFMKVKAMLNRANKLNALRDRMRLVSLDEMDREQIEGISEDFMVRKVAKDIVDIAYLLSKHTTVDEIQEVVDYVHFGAAMAKLVSLLDEELYDEADRIVEEQGLELHCRDLVLPLLTGLGAAES